ncbi:hypothetical protein Bhyg_10543 [Pseudolycoriella hygida]|uniref:Uncharacterized protein n=1 Tax=Pseudolycoriella hygida TaxID=35572 RepID=A0A9Q0MWC1_9DIPT|nr:hypothetical protein Bhyg_10543 [Pseudolycoriella hygida]
MLARSNPYDAKDTSYQQNVTCQFLRNIFATCGHHGLQFTLVLKLPRNHAIGKNFDSSVIVTQNQAECVAATSAST